MASTTITKPGKTRRQAHPPPRRSAHHHRHRHLRRRHQAARHALRLHRAQPARRGQDSGHRRQAGRSNSPALPQSLPAKIQGCRPAPSAASIFPDSAFRTTTSWRWIASILSDTLSPLSSPPIATSPPTPPISSKSIRSPRRRRRSRKSPRARRARRASRVARQHRFHVPTGRRRHRRSLRPGRRHRANSASPASAWSQSHGNPRRGRRLAQRRSALTIYTSTQIPHLARTLVAGCSGIEENRLRVIAPEVGGGFGCKLNVYAEEA